MSVLDRLAPIMFGGALGALARHWVTRWLHASLGAGYPWGTLGVNVLGSFAFGAIWSLTEGRTSISPIWRVFLLSGFMGAFTTFSTFAFEGAQLLQSGKAVTALFNIVLQNALAVAGVFVGFIFAEKLVG